MAWWAVVASCLAASAAAAPADRPPAPELPPPASDVAEARVDALPPGDARASALVDLALRRHAEAERTAAEERARGGRRAARTTPRADARREEAMRLAERALEEAPSFDRAPEALLVAGLDAERIGRVKEGTRWLGALVRGWPDHPLAPEAWLVLGERHLAEGDLTRARAALEAAARHGRPEVRAWAGARVAEMALAAGDGDGAVAALAGALDAGSVRAVAEVEALAAAPARAPLDAISTARLADLVERVGDIQLAAALRDRAAAAAPPDVRAALAAARHDLAPAGDPVRLPGSAPLRVAGRAPAAEDVAVVRARLAAHPDDAEALHVLGVTALEGGRPGEARVLLARALAAGAGAPAQVDLGVALHALGRADDARDAFARAAERDPRLPAAHEDLGAVALALGDAAAAEASSAQAVALDPGRWEARLLHARALAALGRDADALDEAERVLDLARGQNDALQLAAELREKQSAAAVAR